MRCECGEGVKVPARLKVQPLVTPFAGSAEPGSHPIDPEGSASLMREPRRLPSHSNRTPSEKFLPVDESPLASDSNLALHASSNRAPALRRQQSRRAGVPDSQLICLPPSIADKFPDSLPAFQRTVLPIQRLQVAARLGSGS